MVSGGTVYLFKNSLSVGVNGDRMSRASILGQDEIATLDGQRQRVGAETTVIGAATASTATAHISYLS
jgi:hypothetical protein